ncbi:MAG TPA: class I SAM-dependent methyltransferase [Vicinamibacterales bacterium]|nr:class I SAM-dependent methyltransferase [Vicinamibacterales bacterium]
MCDGAALEKVMTLSPTPPGNNFLRPDELSLLEPVYPLDLYLCRTCCHVQLGHVVDPRILYQRSYNYVSGTSSKFVEHLEQYASTVVSRFGLKRGDLVVDIGSNDGTGLRCFQRAGMNVLGVDPAPEIAARATQSGIPTLCEFFSHDLAVRLRGQYGPAAFITSHNACAHIDRLDDVFRGVEHWLADEGVFGVEVGYFLDVYQNTWFDTIYHEHLDYHTVGPFRSLLARVGMEAIGVERVAPQGGSLRLFVQRVAARREADQSVATLTELERQAGLCSPEAFAEFGRRISDVGADLRSLLATLKSQGKSIAGYGAPTKSTTLLNHFRIGREQLDFLVDDNPLKYGLFSPVTHIPVFPPSELYRRRPDYVVILAWNFATPIMAAHQPFVSEGGRFIVPMPTVRIVE